MYGQTTRKDITTRIENLNDLTIHSAEADWSNWPKSITLTIDGKTITYKTLRDAYKALWDTDPWYEHKEIETKAEEPEMKEEEATMTTFTTVSGNTFTTNESGTYFYMIDTNGKKTRIKKSEFEAAQRENEIERKMNEMDNAAEDDSVSLEEFCDMVTNADAAQAELDKEPCHVDRVTIECDFDGDTRFWTVRVNGKAVSNHHSYDEAKAEANKLGKLEEPDEAQDPELERIMEETGLEPADAELERNIRKEKKASKPRRSKDVALEMDFGTNKVTLTAKQVDFLRELRNSEAYKEDEDDMAIEDIAITIGGQFEDKPMTVGAMISTLCEKHLGTRIKAKVGNRTMTLFGLTPNGKDIMNAIK